MKNQNKQMDKFNHMPSSFFDATYPYEEETPNKKINLLHLILQQLNLKNYINHVNKTGKSFS